MIDGDDVVVAEIEMGECGELALDKRRDSGYLVAVHAQPLQTSPPAHPQTPQLSYFVPPCITQHLRREKPSFSYLRLPSSQSTNGYTSLIWLPSNYHSLTKIQLLEFGQGRPGKPLQRRD